MKIPPLVTADVVSLPVIHARLRLAAWAILAALAVATLYQTWTDPAAGVDFNAFYVSALAWRQGHSAYLSFVDAHAFPNLTPPILLALYGPLTWFSFHTAARVWMLLSLALLGAVAWSTRDRVQPWALALIVVGTRPISSGIVNGQISIVLLGLMTAAWLASERGDTRTEGLCVGLLCLIKPFYGLFLLYWLWQRRFRLISLAVATMVVGTLVGLALVGIQEYVTWVVLLNHVNWQAHPANASIWGIAARLFDVRQTTAPPQVTPLHVSIALRVAAQMVGVCVVGWVTLRAIAHDRRPAAVYAVLGYAGVLLSPLGWVYYLLVPLPPLLSLWSDDLNGWLWIALGASAFTMLASTDAVELTPVQTLTIGNIAALFGFVGLLCAARARALRLLPGEHA